MSDVAASKRRPTGGGPGTNQYGVKGQAARRATSGRVAAFDGSMVAATAGAYQDRLVEHEGHECGQCGRHFETGEIGPAAYRCEHCGSTFASDEGSKCDCGKRASREAKRSCPHCQEPIEDDVELAVVHYWTHPDDPGEAFASVDAAIAWDDGRDERARLAAEAEARTRAQIDGILAAGAAENERLAGLAAPLDDLTPDELAALPACLQRWMEHPDWYRRQEIRHAAWSPHPNELLALVGVAPLDVTNDDGSRKPWEETGPEFDRKLAAYRVRCEELGLPDLFGPSGRSVIESSGLHVDRDGFLRHVLRVVGR